MNEITTAITQIKRRVSLQEWQQRIMDCQSSGMHVKAWCCENGISTGSYYFHLRKLREAVLGENRIVPIEKPVPAPSEADRIHIQSGDIRITLPGTASPEQLAAVLRALQPC